MIVEFIESYRKVGNDYQWNDNHGEIVRCKNCTYWKKLTEGTGKCMNFYIMCESNFYCADGERKEDEKS